MNTRRVVVSGGSRELTTALEQLVPASLMAAEIEPGCAQWGHEKTWRHDGLGMIRAEGAGISRQIERIDHHCGISTEEQRPPRRRRPHRDNDRAKCAIAAHFGDDSVEECRVGAEVDRPSAPA